MIARAIMKLYVKDVTSVGYNKVDYLKHPLLVMTPLCISCVSLLRVQRKKSTYKKEMKAGKDSRGLVICLYCSMTRLALL